MKKKWKLLFSASFILALIVLIFIFSSQDGPSSDKLSLSIASFFKYFYEYLFQKEISIKYINHVVRKFAHFSIFGILGLSLSIFFRKLGFEKSKILVSALSLSTLYAFFDEFHQLFIPNRGGEFKDVIIDFSGALFAIIIYLSLLKNKR